VFLLEWNLDTNGQSIAEGISVHEIDIVLLFDGQLPAVY